MNTFEISGTVATDKSGKARTFATEKFGKVTLEVPGERGVTKLDFKAFNADHIDTIRSLKGGDAVTVTGTINVEAIKGKDKVDIEVDGYKVWVPMLRIGSINGVQAVPQSEDNLPF